MILDKGYALTSDGMNPLLLVSGTLSFLACLFIHILLWRIARPKNDVRALVFIFLVLPLMALCLLFFSRFKGEEVFAWLLLHMAFSLSYIATYPIAQAVSPSLEIIISAGKQMSRGLTKEEIQSIFDNAGLVLRRLEELLGAKLVFKRDDLYFLSTQGKFLAILFICYRKMLGLQFKTG